MKKIGIIGGLTFLSTAKAYRTINEASSGLLGGYNTAEVLMISVNPTRIIEAMKEEKWHLVSQQLITAAMDLEKLGADCVLIPCNSIHKIADEIQQNISIPLINMMDCVGDYLYHHHFSVVGLLGTVFTMESGFYQRHLEEKFQIKVKIPSEKDRKKIHHIILNELCVGNFNEKSRNFLIEICHRLADQGCETIILGCTELPLLIKPENTPVPLVNTLCIQSEYAVRYALREEIEKIKVSQVDTKN